MYLSCYLLAAVVFTILGKSSVNGSYTNLSIKMCDDYLQCNDLHKLLWERRPNYDEDIVGWIIWKVQPGLLRFNGIRIWTKNVLNGFDKIEVSEG